MSRPFFLVDSFTTTPYRGNPAGVCLVEDFPADDWLRKVAAEVRASEIAFVTTTGEQRLRWFTPEVEVPLCGHATLAAAYVLWLEKLADPEAPLVFQTKSGPLTCRKSLEAVLMDLPADPGEARPAPASLVEAAGKTPVRSAYTRNGNWIFEYETQTDVKALQPAFARLRECPGEGLLATAPGDGAADFVSRCFFPKAGIDEDPVTGAAHCALGPYWRDRGLTLKSFRALQLSARGGFLEVRPDGDRVELKGTARLILRGEWLG